jgi:ubiquinone/menaquinone biosynthesis C-methylase UbiE
MPPLDPYHVTNQLDDATLELIASRLESRGKHTKFEAMLGEYLGAMKVDDAERVLDLGCGTGIAARAVAGRSTFSGQVLGVDQSAYLVDFGRRLADEEQLSKTVRFETGDSHSLNLADSSFDAVIAHTLLSHVSDPKAVLSEMARLTRSGGYISVFDGDYASLTFDQEDPAKAKADDEKVIAAMVVQPRVMRQLPRLAAATGLTVEHIFSYVVADAGKADFWLSGIESLRSLLPKSGVMSENEANTWVDAQLAASEAGVFFGASNFYAYVLRKP